MKYRLLLVVLLFVPFILKGQADGVKLYSKGKMYVKYKDSNTNGALATSTTLHIEGSVKFTNGAAIDQKGRTQITGDFINELNTPGVENNLFLDKTATADGVVAFVGKDNKQTIKSGLTVAADIASQKAKNYIYFPTIRVEKAWTDDPLYPATSGYKGLPSDPFNTGFLSVAPNMAMTVNNLTVLNSQRFRIESEHDDAGKLNTGHVYIKTLNDSYGTTGGGFSEFYLKLYSYTKTAGGNYATTLVPDFVDATNTKQYLAGFTPPFTQLGADYMLYQVLTKPNGYSLTSYEGPVTPPTTIMQSGKGYFMAMDVYKDNYATIQANWPGTTPGDRFIGDYMFSRKMFKDYYRVTTNLDKKANFNKFDYSSSDGNLIQERFNVGEVTVNLQAGLNFLGNPFMAPISLNPLVNWESNATTYVVPELGNATVSRQTADVGTIRDKYWVINHATVQNKNGQFEYFVTYDFVSKTGASVPSSTGIYTSILNPEQYLIAPMQMFCLQAASNVTIKLMPTLIKHGNARMAKSGGVQQLDWFVMEAEAVEDGVKDRTTVTFKEGARLAYQENLDTRKGLTKSIEESKELAPVTNLLFTKTSDGIPMLGQVVPGDVKELALFYAPPATSQLVRIRPYGLGQLDAVSNVWLIDKYENKTIKLTSETVYEFLSQPVANNEPLDNRFILRFYDDNNGIIVEEQQQASINSYYNSSILYITGLNEEDIDSTVQIFDLQGRLMAKTRVNNAPSMEFVKPLSQGTYIVRITGKRNYTTKFVNLHN